MSKYDTCDLFSIVVTESLYVVGIPRFVLRRAYQSFCSYMVGSLNVLESTYVASRRDLIITLSAVFTSIFKFTENVCVALWP